MNLFFLTHAFSKYISNEMISRYKFVGYYLYGQKHYRKKQLYQYHVYTDNIIKQSL